MKNVILLLALSLSFLGYSQDLRRIEVQGKINVEDNDVSGITIFNASSNQGTITDDNGEFKIAVRLNDKIEVSALQFQNITFTVNEDIIKSKTMKLFLIDQVNELDTVVLLPNNLSGSLKVDMNRNVLFQPKMDALYFAIANINSYEFENDYKTAVTNNTMPEANTQLVNGLNIKNIVDQLLLPLFRSKTKNKDEKDVPDIPIASMKHYFSTRFLTETYNIPENRVPEFIRYVQDENFDYSLLNKGNEMAFLELLTKKSKSFLSQ